MVVHSSSMRLPSTSRLSTTSHATVSLSMRPTTSTLPSSKLTPRTTKKTGLLPVGTSPRSVPTSVSHALCDPLGRADSFGPVWFSDILDIARDEGARIGVATTKVSPAIEASIENWIIQRHPERGRGIWNCTEAYSECPTIGASVLISPCSSQNCSTLALRLKRDVTFTRYLRTWKISSLKWWRWTRGMRSGQPQPPAPTSASPPSSPTPSFHSSNLRPRLSPLDPALDRPPRPLTSSRTP